MWEEGCQIVAMDTRNNEFEDDFCSFVLFTHELYVLYKFVQVFGTAKHFQIFFQALRETSHKNYGHDTAGRAAHVWRRSSPERARTFHGVARQGLVNAVKRR